MKKIILNIVAVTLVVTTAFVACDKKQTDKEVSGSDSVVGGLNSQPEQEVDSATPSTNDSLAKETRENNPPVGGMDGQLEQSVKDTVSTK